MGGVSLRVICGFQLNASFLTAYFHYCVLICGLLETSCWVSSCSFSCAQSSVTKHSSGWQATPLNCQLKVFYMCLFCFYPLKKGHLSSQWVHILPNAGDCWVSCVSVWCGPLQFFILSVNKSPRGWRKEAKERNGNEARDINSVCALIWWAGTDDSVLHCFFSNHFQGTNKSVQKQQ